MAGLTQLQEISYEDVPVPGLSRIAGRVCWTICQCSALHSSQSGCRRIGSEGKEAGVVVAVLITVLFHGARYLSVAMFCLGRLVST